MTRYRLSHPGVWLATLSTVVGIATGMFTLRDQIIPPESGSARAALGDYQASIGEICLAMNDADSAGAQEARSLARRLPRARSIPAKRDLLLNSTNQRISDLVDQISKLGAVGAPKAMAREHRAVRAAWERNLDRIRDYGHQLDGAGTPAQLAAALDVLYRHRPSLSRDGAIARTGIARLGGRQCHLNKPIVTPNVTIPRLGDRRGKHHRHVHSANPPGNSETPRDGSSSVTPPASSIVPPTTPTSGGGSANPPTSSTPPPTPSTSGSGSANPPVGAGGSDGDGSPNGG